VRTDGLTLRVIKGNRIKILEYRFISLNSSCTCSFALCCFCYSTYNKLNWKNKHQSLFIYLIIDKSISNPMIKFKQTFERRGFLNIATRFCREARLVGLIRLDSRPSNHHCTKIRYKDFTLFWNLSVCMYMYCKTLLSRMGWVGLGWVGLVTKYFYHRTIFLCHIKLLKYFNRPIKYWIY
jgi:hypothetical protein